MSDPGADGRPRSRIRAALRVALAVVVVVGAVSGRVIVAGERALATSTEALRAGDPARATTHAREAATWFAPGASHVRVAYGRLLALGREAEKRRLREPALEAYRAVVTASASTRLVIEPFHREVDEARVAIARLEASGERAPSLASEPAEAIEREQLAELARTPRAMRPWSLVLAGSLVAMAAGLVVVLRRGFDETGRTVAAGAVGGAVLVAVGLCGFVAALVLA